MKQGILFYDSTTERYDFKYGEECYYGGLHCGECMELNINGTWIPVRIELSWNTQEWYFVGLPGLILEGFEVRMK